MGTNNVLQKRITQNAGRKHLMKNEVNIFARLSEYLPEENYFTNCFAFLLDSNKPLTLFLIKELLGRKSVKSETLEQLKPEDLDIHTQRSYFLGKHRIITDIRVSASNKLCVLIENKLRGQISDIQIRNYLQLREKLVKESRMNEVFVFLLTLRQKIRGKSDMHDRGKFLHFTWSDINDLLKTYSFSKKEKSKYFLESFLEFMEEKGMESFSGFQLKKYGSAWELYARFRKNAILILKEVIERLPKEDFRTGFQELDEDCYLGCWFRKKTWKKRFGYAVYFDLAPLSDKAKQEVWFNVGLYFQKGFREFLRGNFYTETAGISEKLSEDFDVEWDLNRITRSITLWDLITNVKSKDTQRKIILDYVTETIGIFEKIGLTSLLEKAVTKYKSKA